MNRPEEEQWTRSEKLADEVARLAPNQIPQRLSQLAASGEPATVLTLLGSWVALPPLPDAFKAGTVLGGRYTLREKLGDGGMGSVWRARQELIGRDVALKIIHPALVTPVLKARFVAEMEILGRLDHPGIVRIFDAGLDEGATSTSIPFFAMELIEGESLDLWATTHRKRRVDMLHIAAQVCAALASAHERQIVHRDLKPSNILVRKSGQPVILDFGVARLRGLVLGEQEGVFSGTPNYAAPEQHLGRDHDFRSGESVDIYAVGIIAFEILTGRKVFEFDRTASLAQMRQAVLSGAIPKLTQVLPDSPPALEEIIGRATRLDPADRFYSVAALGRALDRVGRLLAHPEAPTAPWSPAERAIIPGTSWVLLEKVGEGGAGEVWMGAHKQLQERRVFKFCNTEEKARTLKREVTLFRLLKERVGRNPHFITLHEVSLDEPPWYLMMDYVEARDLENWCAAQPGGLAALTESQRLEIIIQAAEALQAAHEAGILHRDIKPANLLVRNNPAGDLHVYIADFGIGQLATEQLIRDQTRLGFTRTVSGFRYDHLSGTLLYLAPEILEGNPATVRSDIYSLGVVLWQLLTGNLQAALDPSDWPTRISDPPLREILYRCLAGSPEKRWDSAGQLADSLRSLPERRQAEEHRRAEMAARERAAYRRGIVRAAAAASVILALVVGLGVWAWLQSRAAKQAHAEIALEQAGSLPMADLTAGRRKKGLKLLDDAAAYTKDRAQLRTAAAKVLGLSDLISVSPSKTAVVTGRTVQLAKQPDERCRAVSADGVLVAVARNLDGLNGAVDLFDASTSRLNLTLSRTNFPWMPVGQPGMLQFSQDHHWLAVGGAETSRHVLVFDTAVGTLRAYLYHGSDPISCAWHPDARWIATGSVDGSVRLWDIAAAVSPAKSTQPGNQFDLPPLLDIPALDVPLFVLPGQRGPTVHLAFGGNGRWLAVLDDTGDLRIYSPFAPPTLSSTRATLDRSAAASEAPIVAVETEILHPEQVARLSARGDDLVVQGTNGFQEHFRFITSELPQDLEVSPELVDIAWNDEATELCVLSLTDAFALQAQPLASFYTVPGCNAVALGWNRQSGTWAVATDDKLQFCGIPRTAGTGSFEGVTSFPLKEAITGQGTRTDMGALPDGRISVYRGRKVQFFGPKQAAPADSSLFPKGGGGQFRRILWDATGRLLGTVFAESNGWQRVESWKTSADLPPKCEQLPVASLECQRVIAANDGRNLIARSTHRGLFAFDPATGIQRRIEDSAITRQDYDLAASNDGHLLALVANRETVVLLGMPDGTAFATFSSPRHVEITALRWAPSGKRLASLTDDGHVQVWNVEEWQHWLAVRGLDK
jgi:serine/threonine protein kinase/WD40 repeat protein